MFHKNIPNNNKDIIRFLAKNFAGTKKVRNAILFCSVVIGIVAITMVFGISVGKIQAEEIRLIRENGTASSGRIEDGTEEQYAKLKQIIYIFLTIFLYLLKCPQSLILSALRAFCFCGKPHISRSIFLYFRYQAWLKSW